MVSMVWSISSNGAAPPDSPCIFFVGAAVLFDVLFSKVVSNPAFALLLMRKTVSTLARGWVKNGGRSRG